MDKSFCKKCGSEIIGDNKFCSNCGAKLKKVKTKKTEKNNFLPYLLTSLITVLICLLCGYLYINYGYKNEKEVIETTKYESNVTVTDKGIAEAVSKVYDSVVVVENYVNGSLYSTGTGFVYKTDDNYAYIITNKHVIDNTTETYVIFTDDSKVLTEVLGSDEYQDIAVLKIAKTDNIKVATIGSSEDLKVGDTTFAVGAPLDSSIYSWTVTRGILSGKNRLVEYSLSSSIFNTNTFIIEVLQTDTAINSGNSGGPLCNANGEVIGVTNMKIASSSVEGMAFALPIENVVKYADKIINGESIERPYLGITMYDITISKSESKSGVYIRSIEKNSAAEKAGLEVGDVIISINDTTVTKSSYLKYELYKYNVGDTVTIKYIRNNKEYETKVTLKSNNSSI